MIPTSITIPTLGPGKQCPYCEKFYLVPWDPPTNHSFCLVSMPNELLTNPVVNEETQLLFSKIDVLICQNCGNVQLKAKQLTTN